MVTLHARICRQMSIVDDTLYCLQNNTFFLFDMTKPNSDFRELEMPGEIQNDVVVGYIASRERRLFVLGQSNLYRVSNAFLYEKSPFPPTLVRLNWSPTLYNVYTDRLCLNSVDKKLYFWIGMDSFWNDVVSLSFNNSFSLPPFTTLFNVVAFSATNLIFPSWMILLTLIVLALAN